MIIHSRHRRSNSKLRVFIPTLLSVRKHLPHDILKEKWSPVYNVRTILLSIQSLLGEPNNDSPLNVAAAQLWASPEEYKAVLLKKYKEDVKL